NALGLPMRYAGALGTSVVKVFDAAASSTGLSEGAARAAGLDAGAAVVVKEHHAGYYPGAHELYLKLVYDRGNGKVLGAEAFGEEGVEKRIDVVATALAAGMTLQQVAELDLAYAPPFSSANDPVNMAAFVGLNDVSGFSPTITAGSFRRLLEDGRAQSPRAQSPQGSSLPQILDVRTLNEFETSHVKGSLHIPLDELRFRLEEVPRGKPIVLYCRSGYRAHLALRILKENGFAEVKNVTGGFLSILAEGGFPLEENRG
ncbi:MAG TPA: rhodanese-like domain-containing protein, partial [Spirochaetia bacterium]|nr:rhodanese-like domain-containing protein [Spirochaetia bacterium]